MPYLNSVYRRSVGLVGAVAALGAALAGCATDQATKAIEQTDESSAALGNAMNRAKAVSGTVEEHQSAAYLDRQSGANGADDGGGLGGDPHRHHGQGMGGAPGMPGAPGMQPGAPGAPTGGPAVPR